ncbi:MAG: potassium channel family protein [Planctomycetota bacterium]|jgi:trk system potassium uptake protein TrkA
MSKKRCIVVGLGEFGRTMAVDLARLGVDVLAVDRVEKRVAMVRDDVTVAAVADVKDGEAIKELVSTKFDLAIIAIGGSLESSILAAMHLKANGVDEVWAEAGESAREDVLRRIGVDRVFSPERDLARRLAQRIARQDLADFIPLAEDHGVIEMPAPEWMVGKTLLQLDLRKEMNVAVISITTAGGQVTVVPRAGREIKEGDTLVLVGSDEDLLKLRERGA